MTEYAVVYERGTDRGWGAHCPDLPGCYALGDSRTEVERNMREAIAAHLTELRRRGQPITDSHHDVGVISVPAA